MKKRIFAFLLSALLLLTALCVPAFAKTRADHAADVDEDGSITAHDAAIIVRYLARWKGYVDGDGSLTYPGKALKALPKDDPGITSLDEIADFRGREFKILAATSYNGGGLEYRHLTTRPEIDGSGDAIYSLLNQATIRRNQYLEETYSCQITAEFTVTMDSDIKTSMLSGESAYDLIYLPLSSYARYAASGFLLDLNAIPSIDTSSFDTAAANAFTVDGKLFAALGAATPSVERAAYAILANRALVTEKTGEDVLSLVKSGNWTVDKMVELAAQCDTEYQIAALNASNYYLFAGAGGSLSEKDSATGTYSYPSVFSSASVEAINLLKKTEAKRSNAEGKSALTASDAAPFTVIHLGAISQYTDDTADWAVLPMPKAEVSASYRNVPNLARTFGFVIPSTVKYINDAGSYGFASPANLEGYFLTAFFAASQENGVRTAYREELVNLTFMKSSAAADKAACLDLLINSTDYDYNYYLNANSMNSIFATAGVQEVNRIASAYSAKRADAQKTLSRAMALIQD